MIPTSVFDQVIESYLAPLQGYLRDDSVSELLINGPREIYVERHGRLERVAEVFDTEEELLAALRSIAQFVGRPLGPEHPILEARLPDGSRVEAVLPPAAPAGPTVAIRRFRKDTLTVQRLIELGSVTGRQVEALRDIVATKKNVLVAGGTGSGKTSLLNCLSSFINAGERTVVIEDAKELQLQQPHVVHLEARPADAKGRGRVTIRDLFRASLRLRPDRIVVGELRGGEALELVQAMTSGHGGCLSTIHASEPEDALRRLETLALMSDVELPLAALRRHVASAVDVIVQTSRLGNGARTVTHVTRVIGVTRDGYQLEEVVS